MQLPLWIRRLPHNLSTIRPFVKLSLDRLYWGLGVDLYFHANKGDEHYLFRLSIQLGPVDFTVGLADTPEENAWIP